MNGDPQITGEDQTAKTVAKLTRADEPLKVEIPRIALLQQLCRVRLEFACGFSSMRGRLSAVRAFD
jgi:hypothetical protein